MNTRPQRSLFKALRSLTLAALLANQLAAQALAASTEAHPVPQVTVVLAGGGAKGYAHLALLRRLEQDHIHIAKIVGTSIGAVIGSLYASGMSTQQIEAVIGRLDPGRVALDQVDRSELPQRIRQYQQRYPVDLELGVKNGQLTFARGVSDGQRFLSLLQELTANVATNNNFDTLKIPFRAVATRYRDGELTVFDHGSLALAVRASMAAPGVFAPVEIDGETYVDGGLVSNLPVDVALLEGADIIVASYLGDTDKPGENLDAGNALTVANRMLDILMRQNERRNIALLRPQDILVRPQLQNFGFSSFNQPADIIRAGQEAVQAQDARFKQLAQVASVNGANRDLPTPSTPAPAITIAKIRATGTQDVAATFIDRELQPLLGQPYQAHVVSQQLDALYASGNFERLDYQLNPLQDDQYELVVNVKEKTYGPNFFKTSLGFFSETSGNNQFSFGVGYRRPWLTPEGLELQADLRAGSQSELAVRAYQPLTDSLGINAYASLNSNELPIYRPDVTTAQRMASATLRRQELGFNLSYDLGKDATARIGLVTNQTRVTIDTAKIITYAQESGNAITYTLQDGQWEFTGISAQFTADLLDSPSFPTRGYYLNVEAAQGVTGKAQYTSFRTNALWATSWSAHVLNLGLDLGADHLFDCSNCAGTNAPAPLYLGGFQSMGAYQMGQLNGDRLVHVQATYMYRLTDGGIFRQPTYVGLVAEAGDAWFSSADYSPKYSGTAFIGVDSKIGDIYFGAASGSGGNRNIFLQLGRRFSLW